jgi:uncharacterized protein YyaL (SSP411 family)
MDIQQNTLDKESSPYLLQHKDNPVHWQAWSTEVFEEAKRQNKLVLVSIGYSACHWCHVMEHECFEDPQVAELMNKHFINIKVDREERPDVDQVYMEAVQMMNQQGGWPLNCFTTPDGRPIHGGTYFPKEKWMHLLESLEEVHRLTPDKVEKYAEQLTDGLKQSDLIEAIEVPEEFKEEVLIEMVQRWMRTIDMREGGPNRAPKFPLPSNYSYLLRHAFQFQNNHVLQHALLTLDKMERGGIYDQIGGGFSRYSVDVLWKVPHFEKMLYDNGQLLELYADAYSLTENSEYKKVLEETVGWLNREMLSSEGGIYSALDADSEGEEGKFYCWTKQELESVLEPNEKWVFDYFEVNDQGHWEEGKHIFLRRKSDKDWMHKWSLTQDDFYTRLGKVKEKLLEVRSKRIRPGLDNKQLCSWNALALKGLVKTYMAIDDIESEALAKSVYRFIKTKMLHSEDQLNRNYMEGKTSIKGFLEDYAFTISAFLDYYECFLDEEALQIAKKLVERCILDFSDEKSSLFYFTSEDTELIARKIERHDNVQPSSNSEMAKNLYRLGHIFNNNEWITRSKKMLILHVDNMTQYGSSFSNWANLYLDLAKGTTELCSMGKNALVEQKELKKMYLPHLHFSGGKNSEIEVFNSRLQPNKTLHYVCKGQSCQAPIEGREDLIGQIKG